MKKLNVFWMIFALLTTFSLWMVGCDDDDSTSPATSHYADENWDDANLVRGGKLYDKWWKINDGTEPTEDFDPVWGTQSTNTRSAGDTWRCKECHGWDYVGELGRYSSGNHYTGFTGIWEVRNDDKTTVFDAVKDDGGDHDFSEVLSDADVLDLTKFVVEGQVDMRLYLDYNSNYALLSGEAGNGEILFTNNCQVCHTADGIYGDPVEYISDLANDNPQEVLHKIRWGHPGTAMPSMVDQGLTIEEQMDILAYSQTLPGAE